MYVGVIVCMLVYLYVCWCICLNAGICLIVYMHAFACVREYGRGGRRETRNDCLHACVCKGGRGDEREGGETRDEK